MDSGRPTSFTPGRGFRAGISATVGVAALLVVVLLVNYLAATRLRWRRDVTDGDRFALSPLTLQVLAALTNEVKVTVLFRRDAALFSHVDGLLRQYATEQPLVKLRVVDHDSDPNAALLLKATYRLGPGAENVVIFDNGVRVPQVVSQGELSVYDADVAAMMAGENREIRRSAFKGELLFTSALAALGEVAPARACFLVGHGEHRPDGEDQLFGYRAFARMLGTKGVELETVRLDGTNALPADCELLVIAGPTEPLVASEVARIGQFLDGGGRLLLILHPYAVRTRLGIETLLQEWGVGIPAWYAGDEQNTKTGLDLYTGNLGSHPITRPLARDEARVYFPLPRVVGRLPAEMLPVDAPRAEVLVSTSPAGLTKSDVRQDTIAFRPGVDQRGEIPLAVAAERGGVAGVTAGRGTGRLVVIGDSSMFGNAAFGGYANAEFAELCVAWLLDRTQMLAIGPKPIREFRVELSGAQMRAIQGMLLGALPGGVLLLGFVVWFRRRS